MLCDFNEMINQGEKMGGRPVILNLYSTFNNTMHDYNLIDLGFNGLKFTWTNRCKRNVIYERLDRGWGNMEWFKQHPNYSVWHLPRITSDHCPILAKLDTLNKHVRSTPFYFEPMWQ